MALATGIAGVFCLVLALGVARFASAPDELLYQLFLLLLLPAAVACFRGSWSAAATPIVVGGVGGTGGAGSAALVGVAGLVGLALLGEVALRPTTEARGYLLAAVAWLSLFVTFWLAAERRVLRALYLFLILLGAFEALYGLVQAVGGVDQIGTYVRGLGRVATGTYINRNHFAAFLNMSLALALGALFAGYAERRERSVDRSEAFAWTWLILLSCALLGVAVFLSLSRGGALVLIATLGFVFVLLLAGSRRKSRRGWPVMPARVAAMLLVATVGLGLAYGVDRLLERFAGITGTSETSRTQIYRDTLELIADHPWAGVGPGMYRFRFRAYQTTALDRSYDHAHNDYLQSAAEWGIPLALLFWGFVVWRGVRAVRLFLGPRSAWRRGVGLGCAAAIFGLLLHSLVDFNLQIPATLALFAVVLGLGWAAERAASEPAAQVSLASAPGNAPDTGAGRRRAVRAARVNRLLFRVLLPLAMAVAAWRVVPRLVALELALADPSPTGLERALAWDSENPDLPFMLAGYFGDVPKIQDLTKATQYAQRAAALSPHSWKAQGQLAQLLEVAGLEAEAESAYLRTVALSPRDGIVSWRLANFYVRSGELDKVFGPLAKAVAAEPSLLRPAFSLLIKLETDLAAIDAIWPDDPASRWFLFGELLRQPGLFAVEPLDTYLQAQWEHLLALSPAVGDERSAGEPAGTVAQGAPYVAYLLGTGHLGGHRPAAAAAAAAGEARRIWSALAASNQMADPAFASAENLVWNGRFELPLVDGPLAWRIERSPAWRVTAAAKEGLDDSTALRIDFNGKENLSFAGVRQTVLIDPGKRYELSFELRSRELTTDRGLAVEVYSPQDRRVLARSDEIRGTRRWSRTVLTFAAAADVDRVELRLQRARSLQLASRLAGTVWLDDVRMVQGR